MSREKPIVHGPVDGNIFAVLQATRRALKDAGQLFEIGEMMKRVMGSNNYSQALGVCMEYVKFQL